MAVSSLAARQGDLPRRLYEIESRLRTHSLLPPPTTLPQALTDSLPRRSTPRRLPPRRLRSALRAGTCRIRLVNDAQGLVVPLPRDEEEPESGNSAEINGNPAMELGDTAHPAGLAVAEGASVLITDAQAAPTLHYFLAGNP